MELTDCKALVTGGGGGLGRYVLEALAGADVDVAIAYNSGRERAETAAEVVRRAGRAAHLVRIDVTDEALKLAERRVRLGLLLAELGQKAKIEVSDAEMTQAIMAQARQYQGQERQFFEFVQQNPQMQQQLRAPIFEDKVVDFLLEMVQTTDKEISVEELMRDPDEDGEDKPAKKAKAKKASAKKAGAKKASAKKAAAKKADAKKADS